MYHRIRDLPANADAESLTWTVSPTNFTAQLDYLAVQGYHTITLDQLVAHFQKGAPLPSKAIAITFDDGWKEHYTIALPALQQRGLIATFFVMPDYMGYGAYLDWSQTKALREAGMVVGAHTLNHTNLRTASDAEAQRQLQEAKARLEKQLGGPVTAFAYPYGAYREGTLALLKRLGYTTAVTLNPGAARAPLDPLQLPRLRIEYRDSPDDFAKKLTAAR